MTLSATESTNYQTTTYNIAPSAGTNTLNFTNNGATTAVVNLSSIKDIYSNNVNFTVSINATIDGGLLTFQGSGSNSFNFSGILSNGASAASVTKTGSSTLTLSGANTFSGGLTLSAGTLNINNASALGATAGTFTMANGVKIDNTSAGVITNSQNNAQVWNGNFTWLGTKALNLGTGAVTLGANSIIAVGGTGALTVGGSISDGVNSYSLTMGTPGSKNTGTLILTNTSNSYDGGTFINSGFLQIAAAGSLGGSGANVTVNSGGALNAAYALDQTTLGRLTSDSTGVIGLAANSSNNLDFSAATGANLAVTLGGTGTYSGTFTPQGQTYRLGGAGGTLVMSNALGDVNSLPTALAIGSGGSAGTVTLGAAGTYSGGATVMGVSGSTASVLQTNILTGVSNTPFGPSNSAIILTNGTIGFGSAATLAAGNVMNVTGYDVTFDTGNIKLQVGSGSSVTYTANSLNQSSLGGVLSIAPTSAVSLGTTEKIFVTNASSTIPLTVTNGMIAPSIIDSTNKTFLTYDAVKGFSDATTTTVSGANNVVSLGGTDPNTTVIAYALKTGAAMQASDNFTIGAGGFLSTVSQNNGSGVINFGSTPGYFGIYGSGSMTTSFNATAGVTFYGTGTGFNGVGLNIKGGLTFASGSWSFTPQPTGSEIFQTTVPNSLVLLSGATITESQGSKMTFASIDGSGTITETASNGFTLTINGLTSTGTSTFSGAIVGASGGTGNIIKTGANTQVFAGANSYNGTTTINGGALVFDTTTNPTVLSTATALSLGGGTFQLKGASGAARSQTFGGLTVSGGANVVDANNVAGGTSTTITLGNIARSAGGTVDFKASVGTFGSTAIVGTTKANDASGILGAWATVNGGADFAANNGSNAIVAYTGYTDIAAIGSTIADATTANERLNSAGSGGNVALGAATTNINTLMQNTATAATIDTAAKTLRVGILGGIVITPTGQALTIGTAANSGTLTAGGNATNVAGELILTNNSANTLTINSVVANNGASGTVAVTKTGSGLTVLNGTNTYTGATTVNVGTLQAGSTSALGSNSAVTLVNASGVVLDINGFNNTVGSLNGGGTIGGNVTLGSATLTTGGGNGSGSYAGVISGTGGLTKTGTATQTLTGANTYTGTTTISGGTLQLGSGGSTGSLSTSGAFTNNGTLTINRNNAVTQGTDISSAAITGTGAFTQAGSGTTTLNAANTYTGATSITAGTLVVGSLNSVVGGTSSSSLGAPTTGANGTIALGSSTTSSQLTVVGTGETTDRVIKLAGTTGGGVIDQSGSGLLKFTSAFTATGAGIGKTLTLQGSTAGTGEIGGAIVDNSGTNFTKLAKSGTGTWTLSGTNTYTGSTTLNAGTLKLDYSTNNTSKLSNTAVNGTLLLNGGTLELSGGSHTETVLSTTLATGGTFIKQTGGTSVLSMGAITFSSGAIDFGAANIATTTSANDGTGILSQRATVAGTDFAAVSATNIVAYTGYATFSGTMAASTNYALAGTSSIAGAVGATTNTLKITTTTSGQSLALGANTLTTGAILFAGANDYAISTSGAGKIVSTVILNYGTGTLSLGALGGTLTQLGTGKTILTTAATTDNSLTVNGGTVQFSDNLQIGTNASVKTITLNNGKIVADTTGGSIALDSGGGTGANARNVTLNNGGGTIDVIGGNTLTISGVISGAVVTFGSGSSSGTIALTAPNSYTGATTISGGTLQLGSGGTTGSLSTSSTIVNNSNLTINRSNAVVQGTDFKAAAITGTGSFTQAGSGTTTLNQANTYSGGTNINGGTLALGSTGALGSSGTISFGGGALQYSASNTTDYSSRFSTAASQAYKVDTNSQNATWASNLTSSGGSLTKAGSGILTLSGTNTYSGETTVTGGLINFSSLSNFGTGNITLNGGGLQWATGTTTDISSRTVTIASGGGTLDTNGSNVTLSGTIGGGGGGQLIKAGSGDLFIGTLNSTGGTSVTNGTLTIGSGGATGNIATNSGTTTNLGSTNTYDGVISGGGNVAITGGTTTFTGTNTYGGATTVSGGKLTVGSTGAINGTSGVSIGSGGNFNYNSSTALTPAITFSGTGGTLSGSGTVGAFTLTSGNTISPGNSPDTLTTGAETWMPGGTYAWEINNATGVQGTNWDFISGTGSLDISALLSSAKFNVNVIGLTAGNASGAVPNWTDVNASWKIASFTSVVGTFASDLFNVDASGFTNNNTATGVFSVTNIGNDIYLTYTAAAIPEPSTYAAIFGALALAGAALRRRRRV